MFLVTAIVVGACGDKKHTLLVEDGVLKMDGKPYTVASAEIDYARLPREYWANRLNVLSTMGVNTVTVKIPWMLHESQEGIFNFEGMNDVKEFCRLAQEKGLFVWLHIGPYVGAEWDMGGLPWWLLNVDGIRLRSTQKAFMQRGERYFAALGKELSASLITNGGNIALLQIEEAQGLEKTDKNYLKAVLACAKKSGFDNIVTFTAGTKDSYIQSTLNETYISLDIDTEISAEENFIGVVKYRFDTPQVCSSINSEYKAVWGGEVAARNWNKAFMRMFELVKRSTSFSINGAVAGNSFGATAGASMADGVYKPFTTAHNVDGIVRLWGGIDKDYDRFRRVLIAYVNDGNAPKSKLDTIPFLSSFTEVEVKDAAPLFENLPTPIESENLMTMEQCKIGHGAVLYSTQLPATTADAKLQLRGVHDYAQVFVDGVLVGVVDRRNGEDGEVVVPASSTGAKLDILVDATGRVGDVKGYKDYKGLPPSVELLCGKEPAKALKGWKIYPLPTDYAFATSKSYKSVAAEKKPGYYRVTFEKERAGDFYLYMGDWGKGEVWLNGQPLGRFWSCGPQTALYVPDCWVKEGSNELVIVDWKGPKLPAVLGTDYAQM